jgi:hypothetical protein
MPLLVRPCHRHRFRAVLNDAFRLRREVFAAEGVLEQDVGDGDAASYLVDLDAAGRVIATVRATPGAAAWFVVGHDRHILPFIRCGMTVRVLAPPVLLPGASQLSFAVLAGDPGDPGRPSRRLADGPLRLEDPDEDPSLFIRYGDRAVA